MKMTKHNMAKGFTLVELLVVIAIIAALAALSTPVVLKQQKKAALAEAINNAKQIGYLMKDYDDQFGSFPKLDNSDGTTDAAPASSNAIFKKFYELSKIDVEEVFYAKTAWNKKPDGDAGTLVRFCDAGESGFAYVHPMSSSNAGRAPLLTAPQAAAGNASVTFDANSFGGSMCYLAVDGSVQTLPIKVDGTVTLTRGGINVNIMTFANTDLYGTAVTGLLGGTAAP